MCYFYHPTHQILIPIEELFSKVKTRLKTVEDILLHTTDLETL